MRGHLLQVLWVALLILCIALPDLLGIRPRRARDWRFIAWTIALLTWLLLGLASLRS